MMVDRHPGWRLFVRDLVSWLSPCTSGQHAVTLPAAWSLLTCSTHPADKLRHQHACVQHDQGLASRPVAAWPCMGRAISHGQQLDILRRWPQKMAPYPLVLLCPPGQRGRRSSAPAHNMAGAVFARPAGRQRREERCGFAPFTDGEPFQGQGLAPGCGAAAAPACRALQRLAGSLAEHA